MREERGRENEREEGEARRVLGKFHDWMGVRGRNGGYLGKYLSTLLAILVVFSPVGRGGRGVTEGERGV